MSHRGPIFVGGAGRSGTTLVRVILDTHPRIACGPELKVVPLVSTLWAELRTTYGFALRESAVTHAHIDAACGQLIVGLLEPYRRTQGKARAAEKSPNNVLCFEPLLRMVPHSQLVHVIRDGRDVVCSLLAARWVNPSTGVPIPYTQSAQAAAEYWVHCVRSGREAGAAKDAAARYHELRYEALVTEAETTLRALFHFLNEPWSDRVLAFDTQPRALAGETSATAVQEPIHAGALGRWRRELKPADLATVYRVAGDLLDELGYTR